jgi:hypothetical protein
MPDERAPPPPEPISMSWKGSAKFTGLSVETLRRNRNRLDIRKIGRRTLIMTESLRRSVAESRKA